MRFWGSVSWALPPWVVAVEAVRWYQIQLLEYLHHWVKSSDNSWSEEVLATTGTGDLTIYSLDGIQLGNPYCVILKSHSNC